MFAAVTVSDFLLGFTPFAPEYWAIVVLLVAGNAGAVWFLLRRKKEFLTEAPEALSKATSPPSV